MSRDGQDELELDSSSKGDAVDVGVKPAPIQEAAVAAAQTRTKKLFSGSQLFAFSLTNMALWEGMCSNMWFALYNGGPQTFIFSFIIVFFGAMAQAASLGEMASIQPIAGAQYHWTYKFAPPSLRRFATWIQGWSTWFGYVSLLAGVADVTIVLLESIVSLNRPGYTAGGWHTSVLVIAMCVLQALLNMYCFKLIPWIELVSGVLHVCLFVLFVVVLAVMGTRHSAEFVFLDFTVASGWKDDFISWNLGMLTCVWSFTGFDGAIHMSEETRKAKSAVPRAMFWSIFMNGILAFVMVIVILVAMGSVQDALAADTPIIEILQMVTGSTAATTAMVTGLFVISFAVNLALIASVSRLSWAWARDGGLPSYFAYVHPKHHVPIRSVVLSVFIVCALNLLNIGSGSYVAFGGITALSSLALYLSYAIAIGSILWARFSVENLKLGEWSLGRWGVYVNVFALVYTLWVMVFLPFPESLPVTASNMNYCGPVMVFVLLVALVLWVVRARTHWKGPSLTILDFILANSS